MGVKICHSLLEKIAFDLEVARADNQVDMRYLINMDYSADLPINTMGRRIRTRLYFTSESHLHTVLNVFRFANEDGHPILSNFGVGIIARARELCYLTQIVLRVFEDSRCALDDPRRFRVEILFSPGATATPLHLHETDRNTDASRLGTAPLQHIGREGLTCKDLEDFFEKAIMAGRADGEEHQEVNSVTTLPDSLAVKKAAGLAKDLPRKEVAPPKAQDLSTDNPTLPVFEYPNDAPAVEIKTDPPLQEDDDEDDNSVNTLASEIVRKVVRRKHFWTTVAIGSFVLGTGCLLLAFASTDRKRNRRYNTRR